MSGKTQHLIANRYQLHEQLGEGAMGAVYHATDRLTGESVALKQITLPTQKLQPASPEEAKSADALRLALANEFQNLASLRHPHIISVIDYGFDNDPSGSPRPFFTMNYLPNAQTILEAGDEKSTAEKVELLLSVLEALAYLHRRGILHRDIKPGNVLVTTDDRVRLLDFGLSAVVVDAGERTGTPAYMAPEVIRSRQASQSSDLYAVGVLAYQLFSGQLPFQDVRGVLHRPADLQALGVPRPLRKVIARLIEKDPADRYPNAASVVAALREATPEDASIQESFLQAATFVNRETEIALLTDALEAALAGQGSAWLLGGESGVGKSRLLEELRIRALVQGAQVLSGQGVEGGGRLYQLWQEPLRRVAISTELSDLEASVLQPLLPELGTLLGREIPAAPELEGQAAQQRLVLTIASALSKAARTQPIVLLLDDLQWTDQSLDSLKALNRLVAEAPLLIVGSYRSEERPDLPAELPGMQALTLKRFDPEFIAALSVSMLGSAGAQPQVLDLLQKETEGNAFFLVETVRALAEEAGRLDAVGEMSLPEEVFAGGVKRIIQRRLERVPEEHRPLLKLAAVAGRALDLDVLEAAMPQADMETWLFGCANVAVLEVQGGSWRFTHDKLRAELLAGLTETELPILQRQVAEAYERVYPDDPSYAAALTEHWDAAGEREKTIHYSRIAGDYAADQFANDDAVRYFSRALALMPERDGSEQYALHQAREEIYDRLGQREAQADDLTQLTALANTPAQQVVVALRFGTYHNNVGEYEAAIAISEQAYQWAVESGDGPGQAQAMINSGQAHMQQGAYETATQRYQQAYELAQAATAPIQTARAWSGLGEVAFRQGDYQTAIHYHQQALHLWGELDDRSGQVKSLRNLGQVANAQGKYETAHRYYEKALLLVQQMGDLPHEGQLQLDLGRNEWRQQNEYQRAETYLQQSLTLAQTTGDRRTAAAALMNLGIVSDFQHQNDKAIGYWEQSLVISREIGDRAMEGDTLNLRGSVPMYDGQYDIAKVYYEQGLAIAQEIGDRVIEGAALLSLGMLAKEQKQYDKAMSYQEQSLVIFQKIGDRAWEGVTLNHLGALALAQSAFQQAQTFFQQALAIHQELAQHLIITEIWAGLALAALHQGDLETAEAYAGQVLAALSGNPTFEGTEYPLRTFHFTWQVCQALGLDQADEVLALAAQVMQMELDNLPDPEAQAIYLQQPHQGPLWAAWQKQQGKEDRRQSDVD